MSIPNMAHDPNLLFPIHLSGSYGDLSGSYGDLSGFYGDLSGSYGVRFKRGFSVVFCCVYCIVAPLDEYNHERLNGMVSLFHYVQLRVFFEP